MARWTLPGRGLDIEDDRRWEVASGR